MIAIIDYRAGNLPSVERAVRRLGYTAKITSDPRDIIAADRVIFPGVGAAGAAMESLRELKLIDVIRKDVFEAGKPMLAICIGIQIIFEHSEEDDVACLGLLPGTVKRFKGPSIENKLKVPQIGWNQVHQTRSHPIFDGVPDGAEFYFVNSFHPVPEDPSVTIGETEYGYRFTSAVAWDNLVATQFHLEKSGPIGLKMLSNFLAQERK
ncbi:MAG: imidazole glycerol phosphate synthase subunit HisH [bacterium]